MKQPYDISQINEMTFESEDMADFFANDAERTSFRLTANNISAMPDETKDINALRTRLAELFDARFGFSYPQLEVKCDIKRDTFQKVLRHKNGRSITYKLLAKFCIGINVSVEEAKELFSLIGHELSERNRCDYILLCELANKGTIEDYNDDMIKYGYGSIFSKAD